jgi:DNA repair protein RadC
MQTYQASLHYTLVRSGDHDPLTHPRRFVEYMQGAFEDCAEQESLWLISMNPKRRPIARTLVRTGPLVAAMTSPRDLYRVALHADAHAIAVVRGEPNALPALTVHDTRAIKRFGESAGWLNIEFVDYLVLGTRPDLIAPAFCSWRAGAPGRESSRIP